MKNFQFPIINFQLFIVAFLLLPTTLLATTAAVSVDTHGEEINAIEGVLLLPETINARAQTGNSIVSLWIEEPKIVDGAVRFSGITPGGFKGARRLFIIDGDFTQEQINEARFDEVVALKNDGVGTRIPVALSFLVVSSQADTEPPESFMPAITRDLGLFGGKHFLVFATQDKNSGIERYEVREGRWGRFIKAESPYLLKRQNLGADVYVKAVDNAGNERIVVLKASMRGSWWERYGLFVIIAVLIFVAIVYKKRWLIFAK